MSWEENEEYMPPTGQAPAPRSTGLNPNASSFSFSPSASTFTPSFAATPVAPAPQSQPPVPSVPAPTPAAHPMEDAMPHVMEAPPAQTNGIAPMDEDAHEAASSSGRTADGPLLHYFSMIPDVTLAANVERKITTAVGCPIALLELGPKITPLVAVRGCHAGVDAAAEGVSEIKVSSPSPSPAATPARAPSPAPESSASHAPSPQKDKGGGGHAAAAEEEEDGADEEDQEARNRELRRIHEELQKEDDRSGAGWSCNCQFPVFPVCVCMQRLPHNCSSAWEPAFQMEAVQQQLLC